MKKIYHIFLFVFSSFLSEIFASNANYDNHFLIKPAVTIEDVYPDYGNFIRSTYEQRDELKKLERAQGLVGKIPFFGGIVNEFIDNAVTREANKRGYDQSLHTLILGIAKLIFSDKKILKTHLDELYGKILSREPSGFAYLTQAKLAVLDAIKDKQNQKDKLNTTITTLHYLHVCKLQEEENFPETQKNTLLYNYDEFCNYLVQYKNSKGFYPQYLFLNMLFLHLLKVNNVVRELK